MDDYVTLTQNICNQPESEPYMILRLETGETFSKLRDVINFWNEHHPNDKVFEEINNA